MQVVALFLALVVTECTQTTSVRTVDPTQRDADAAAYGGHTLCAQGATVPPDPSSLNSPRFDQFPLRVCSCALCIINRL